MNHQVFDEFVDGINQHDPEKIYSLMSDNHRFIDAQGNSVIGREKMKAGWSGYFQLFPDYKIDVSEIFVNANTIAAFGFVQGSFNGSRPWRLPAAWKAVVENDKIILWQVYADTKIPFESMKEQ